MKKFVLKFKIFLTNIFRIIYSFLFINVGSLFLKLSKVDAVPLNEMVEKLDDYQVTCYAAPAPGYEVEEKLEQFFSNSSNVFILLVPVVLIALFIIYIRVKKKKDKKDDNKEEK